MGHTNIGVVWSTRAARVILKLSSVQGHRAGRACEVAIQLLSTHASVYPPEP